MVKKRVVYVDDELFFSFKNLELPLRFPDFCRNAISEKIMSCRKWVLGNVSVAVVKFLILIVMLWLILVLFVKVAVMQKVI